MVIISKGFAKGNQYKAISYFHKGNYKQAANIWQKIYQTNPQDIIAIKGLAYCSMVEESYREAIEYLDEGKNIAATDPEIYNFIGLLYLKTGKIDLATDTILNALEIAPKNKLLQNTLNYIKKINGSSHAKTISILPLLQLTLPMTWSKLLKSKYVMIGGVIFLLFSIITTGFVIISSESLLVRRFPANYKSITMEELNINNLKEIINARENYRIVLTEGVITKKFNELRKAISDNKPNKARILANELLASNASMDVKERVSILESFIPESTPDNIDYIPSYAEIASAPSLYTGIMIRWKGLRINTHQTRTMLNFDLIINFVDYKKVEGIAAIEFTKPVKGIHYYNGDNVIVTGYYEGMTSDNRVIIKAVTLQTIAK